MEFLCPIRDWESRPSRFSSVNNPFRDLKLPDHDLFEAFFLQVVVGDGPLYGSEQQSTCVAVAMRKEKTVHLSSEEQESVEAENKRTEGLQELQHQIGRLLWIDLQGHILSAEDGRIGEQLTSLLWRHYDRCGSARGTMETMGLDTSGGNRNSHRNLFSSRCHEGLHTWRRAACRKKWTLFLVSGTIPTRVARGTAGLRTGERTSSYLV